MSSTFQEIILKLQQFWADKGCVVTQPYYTQVGAGTMNPATFLRVLGPEPWNVAYVEPSVRPDDGRYAENPNRFQLHYQYQVILKPDPGNPQELYLESLKALGIDPRQHDIRFVEDNWEQPAISAWGLGWEVWLDGQEITQFTYFQQVGGVTLDPVAVELTYGLERILIALNNAKAIWDEPWGAGVSYGEVRKREEFEHSKYYYEVADVTRVRQMYDLLRAEAEASLAAGLVLPAHDYVLKCSHVFNTLDARGAIGVTERQAFFGQMRDLARRVAEAYLEQRKELEYPLLKETTDRGPRTIDRGPQSMVHGPSSIVSNPSSFVLEIGVEELPASDVDSAHRQLETSVPDLLKELHLEYVDLRVFSTPRRLTVAIVSLAPRQPDREELVKGPPADRAFDKDGVASAAAVGFAKKNGVNTKDLETREEGGSKYVFAHVKHIGRPTAEVLADALPGLIAGIKFDKSMKWNNSGVAFSRPIRWLVALLGETVIPFEYAGVVSGNVTRGLRPYDSPEIQIKSADQYTDELKKAGVVLDRDARRQTIVDQLKKVVKPVMGEAVLDTGAGSGAAEGSGPPLLAEVTNLVEKPTALLGSFDQEYLSLPEAVLITVMKKHQRYFPVRLAPRGGVLSGESVSPLLPNFVAIRNGDDQHLDLVRQGNEHVLGARFADAAFFVREDVKQTLESYRPKLGALVFQKQLGSMLDKADRIEKLVNELIPMLGLEKDDAVFARRAAHLAKADLATQMVTEMTSLQGVIGGEYARRSGEHQAVAGAIAEQYQPVPKTKIGLAVALADRLDSLAGLFALGLAPTGTKDPFGLRRAAIGVVQPLIEHGLSFDLRAAVAKAAALQPAPVSEAVQTEILAFIAARLSSLLKEAGYKYDLVDAVLAGGAHNPTRAVEGVRQLQTWVSRKDWNTILPAFARCVRITRDQQQAFQVDPKAFVEPEEKQLYAAHQQAEAKLKADHGPSSMVHGQASVDDFLHAFLPMIPAINAFFDKVLVMAEDRALQENRLGLLQRISGLADGVADFSKLEGF